MFILGVTNVIEKTQNVFEEVKRMKREGHAVEYYERTGVDGKFIDGKVIHFRTCVKCLLKNGEEIDAK